MKSVFTILLIACIFLFFVMWLITFYRKESFVNLPKDESMSTGPIITEPTRIGMTTVIPLNIFHTWHTKKLPPLMQANVDFVKKENPEFTHYLFDDKDCRAFIKEHFDADVVDAYDRLNPGAYKADLWRYCALWVHGGVYMDIKLRPINNFHFIEIMDRESFTLDRAVPISDDPKYVPSKKTEANDFALVEDLQNYYENVCQKWKNDLGLWEDKQIGIYNALMICKPKNGVLLDCIRTIVRNVDNKFYGYSPLYPTGPGLLGNIYFKGDMHKIEEDEFDLFYGIYSPQIICRRLQKYILCSYPGYREEQRRFHNGTPHYSVLWRKRTVYKEIT